MVSDIFSTSQQEGSYQGKVFAYYYTDCSRYSMEVPHMHQWMEIMYVVDGQAHITVQDHHYDLRKGDYVFINSAVNHMMTVADTCQCKMLNIEFGYMDESSVNGMHFKGLLANKPGLMTLYDSCRTYKLLKDNNELLPVLKNIIRELNRSDHHKEKTVDDINSSLIQLYLSEIMIIIMRQMVTENDFGKDGKRHVDDLIQYIDKQYDTNITTDVLANHISVHPSYVYRLFKKHTGTTINQYLTDIRIEKAKDLLASTDKSIVDIACLVGFNSRQYFSYVFKKTTKLTPNTYRRRHQKIERWSV